MSGMQPQINQFSIRKSPDYLPIHINVANHSPLEGSGVEYDNSVGKLVGPPDYDLHEIQTKMRHVVPAFVAAIIGKFPVIGYSKTEYYLCTDDLRRFFSLPVFSPAMQNSIWLIGLPF